MLLKPKSNQITFLTYGLYASIFGFILIVASACKTVDVMPEGVSVMGIEEKTLDLYKMDEVQEVPAFPGGTKAWAAFMGGYRYPAPARENNVSGTIMLQFVIEKDGSVTNLKTIRDVGFGTGEEAVRLLTTSPKWIPGMKNGVPVRVAYTQPIKLAIDGPGIKSASGQTRTDSVSKMLQRLTPGK